MVTIRLTRRGGKKTPFYHVVVTDSRKRQGGTSLESVGLFNPVARGGEIKLRMNVARIEHWLKEFGLDVTLERSGAVEFFEAQLPARQKGSI